MQLSETEIILAVFTIAIIFFMMSGFMILVVVKNYRNQLKRDAERIKLMDEVQTAERERISENLHDELGAQISSVKLLISQLTDLNENDEIQNRLLIANEAMTESGNLIYSIIRDVNTVTNNEGGLKAALNELTIFLSNSSGIKINLLLDKLKETKNEKLNTHIYRVLKEMMHNSIKHSKAKFITIEIDNFTSNIFIVYSDDGVGFDEEVVNKGMGLSSIRKRLELIQGTMELKSAPNNGVHFTIVIKQ